MSCSVDREDGLEKGRLEKEPDGAEASAGSGFRYPVGRWDDALIGFGGKVEGNREDLDPKGPDG